MSKQNTNHQLQYRALPRGRLKAGTPRKRLSVKELAPEAKEKIFKAAARTVGEYGYAGASIKRITKEAGIAEGTFYLYFPSRQQLFDELLPHVGKSMLSFVRNRVAGARDVYDMEEKGFRAFFEFLEERPGFFRVLNEAEAAAPKAHEQHFRMLGAHYLRALKRGIDHGQIQEFDEEELEAVAYMLMAARNYLHLRYVRDSTSDGVLPEKMVQAYMRMVRAGLR